MTSPGFPTPFQPRVIGHRGASGYAAENSIEAFVVAATPGHQGACDGVELDVRTTADGEFAVIHDASLPDGRMVASVPFRTLRASAAESGVKVATLDEALAVLAGLEVWIEVKWLPADRDAALLEALARHPGCRAAVHAFDHRILARLNRREPALRLGALSASYPIDPVAPVAAAGASTLWQEVSLIDAELVDRCHAAGIEVIAWTVNDAAVAVEMARLGVDALCGDRPDLLRMPSAR